MARKRPESDSTRIARFWKFIDQAGEVPEYAPRLGCCWPWTGAHTTRGYGVFALNRHNEPAHRVAYEFLVGPIPEGLQLDHLCRVRHCVNPSHLEPVTPLENTRRGIHANSLKTHCKRGHEFTPENTRVHNGIRYCRQCERERAARRYAAVRGLSNV